METPVRFYNNGNYIVSINLINGTRRRHNDDRIKIQIPERVENFDLKITNCCDMGCPMCHENSVPNGEHGDIMNLKFIEKIHPWTEIAIGGGNPLEHPDLDAFLAKCKGLNLLPSITVNQVHFERDYKRIKKLVDDGLVKGVGVSLVNPTPEFIKLVKTIPTAIIHVIAGLVTEEQLRALKDNQVKVLILGYKKIRRGATLYNDGKSAEIEKNIAMLSDMIQHIMEDKWFKVLSFDNLALKQLDLQHKVSPEEWEHHYQGDDGIDGMGNSASIFVDAVAGVYAKNSCQLGADRYPIEDLTLDEMYHRLYPNLASELESELENERSMGIDVQKDIMEKRFVYKRQTKQKITMVDGVIGRAFFWCNPKKAEELYNERCEAALKNQEAECEVCA